jgi:hypothetical protein
MDVVIQPEINRAQQTTDSDELFEEAVEAIFEILANKGYDPIDFLDDVAAVCFILKGALDPSHISGLFLHNIKEQLEALNDFPTLRIQ